MVYRLKHKLILGFWGVLAVLPLQALAADPLMDGARQCTRLLSHYEQANGIPGYLLSAIASTESGRWHEGLHIALPWPWTINADGKGYFYKSKEEAIEGARKLKAAGAHNLDVGCMQVSLLHHPNAFRSLEEAFEPEANIAYAARFLQNLFYEQKNWRDAASAYHSKERSSGAEYYTRVYGQWRTITDRVRRAGGTVLAGMTADKAIKPGKSESPSRNYASLRPAAAPTPAPQSGGMKIIEVKSVTEQPRPRMNADVLVISAPQTTASAAPIQISATGEQTASIIMPTRPAPRFIFSD